MADVRETLVVTDELVAKCADAIADKRGLGEAVRTLGMMAVFKMDARAVLNVVQALQETVG